MTGYRSGAIVGDPEAIKAIKSLRTATGTASPEFIQSAAVAAWADDEHVAERRDIFRQKRAILAKAFDSLGLSRSRDPSPGSTCGSPSTMTSPSASGCSKTAFSSPRAAASDPAGRATSVWPWCPTLDECDEAAEALVACLGR